MADYAPFGIPPTAPDAAPDQPRFPPEVMAMLLAHAQQQQQMSPADQAAMQPETYANPMVKNAVGSLATLPRRAIEAAGQDFANRGTGAEPQSIGPALEAATLPMGTGMVAGVPIRAGEAAFGAGMIPGKGAAAKAEWSALRQEVAERRAAAKRLTDTMQTEVPEHVDPFAGMNDAETAAAFERALRAANGGN